MALVYLYYMYVVSCCKHLKVGVPETADTLGFLHTQGLLNTATHSLSACTIWWPLPNIKNSLGTHILHSRGKADSLCRDVHINTLASKINTKRLSQLTVTLILGRSLNCTFKVSSVVTQNHSVDITYGTFSLRWPLHHCPLISLPKWTIAIW